MGISAVNTGEMTVEEFYAFTDAKPDHEKWEPIGGKPVFYASPTGIHGMIVANVTAVLWNRRREIRAPWKVIASTGVRVSAKDRPQPDVLVVSGDDPLWERMATSTIAAGERLVQGRQPG